MSRYGPVARAPLWRPVAAYAAGIVIAANVDIMLAAVFAAVATVACIVLQRKNIYTETVRAAMITVLFVSAGMGATYLYEKDMPSPLPEDEAVYKCRVTDEPYFKGKTWRCRVDVMQRMDSVPVDRGTKAILYLADTTDYSVFREGDCFYANVSFSLPLYDSGYCRYLLHNSICGTAYVAPGNLHYIGREESGGLMAFARGCRLRVLEWYRQLGFRGDTLAVLSALTLGVKDEISDELREDYSVSGASHVLALSGLHVGLIFLVLGILLSPLKLLPGGKYISWGLLTVMLFCFAVFTGLSPSVVRACFMMSAFGFTSIIMRGGTSLNTLFLIALCLLVYNPMYIYNVSFLLSFVAVLFILLFYPVISARLRFRNKAVKYVADLFAISMLAQIGVTPIVAYYFGSFSVFGVLSSIIIVPLLTLLMYVIVAMLLFSWWHAAAAFIAGIAGYGIELMNGIVSFFSSLPSASVAGMEPWFSEMAVFYILCIALIYLFGKFTPFRLRMALAGVVLLLFVENVRMWNEKNRNEIVFTSGFDGAECSYFSPYGKTVFDRNLPDTVVVSSSSAWQTGNVAYFGGKRIVLLDSPLYEMPVSETPIETDYLWISRGAKGSLDNIEGLYDFRHIILDTSLTPYYNRYYSAIADSLGIPYTDMKKNEKAVFGL